MLRGPTFYLIYRHTLALISALFNVDLSTLVPNLFPVLYISVFPATRASYLSRLSATGMKSFQILRCRFKRKKTCDLLDLSILVYRNDLHFIPLPLPLPFPDRFTEFLFAVSPLDCTYEAVLRSSRFNFFRSRWHEEKEIFVTFVSLKQESIWYLTVYIEAKLGVTALNEDSVYPKIGRTSIYWLKPLHEHSFADRVRLFGVTSDNLAMSARRTSPLYKLSIDNYEACIIYRVKCIKVISVLFVRAVQKCYKFPTFRPFTKGSLKINRFKISSYNFAWESYYNVV